MDMYLPEILFGGFMLLLLLGAPITVALGGAAMGAYVVLDKDPIALVQIAFTSVSSFPLMALPAFVLAGALMEAAGISRRLVDIAETLAGPITGGLGAATVLACLFFGAISGSGPATTAAVGRLDDGRVLLRNFVAGWCRRAPDGRPVEQRVCGVQRGGPLAGALRTRRASSAVRSTQRPPAARDAPSASCTSAASTGPGQRRPG